MTQGLGTQLRHLLELLDGAVAEAYVRKSLRYRPRYTPVMRALLASEPRTISQIAEAAGISQPATTQTVGLMIRDGIVSSEPGPDARQRMIRLTEAGRDLLPDLQACWRATAAAAGELDAELCCPLSQVLADALAALERKSFGERIAEAAPEDHVRPESQVNGPNKQPEQGHAE